MSNHAGECPFCLNDAPLLLPVKIETPSGDGTIKLCKMCRTGWRDDQYASLADPHRKTVKGQ